MRSEAWRSAAAARNRSPREAREVARQALRPGCEELAARIRRQMPAVLGRRAPKETEARPRVKNRHAGAPRGERPASWDARRLASASQAPERFSALRPPLDSGWRSKVANPGRKTRRGNESGCLKSE